MRAPAIPCLLAALALARPALAQPEDEASPRLRVYGFLKPAVNLADGAVESFSQPNATAPTAAGNPALATLPGDARLSFQVGQSRLGLWIHEEERVRGHLELDFVDFAKATPTVASLPRLRLAYVEWRPSATLSLSAGQDWDLVQPVMTHGLNLVGALFGAGNTAFMRQQVRALVRLGELELGGLVGMQGVNAGARDGAPELSATPVFEGRVQWSAGRLGRVGLSGLVTSLLLGAGTPDEVRTIAALAGVYGELRPDPSLDLRFEGYWSRNGANLGLLGLAQGRAGAGGSAIDVEELGGFASVRAQVIPLLAVHALFGGAAVRDDAKVAPSYAYAGVVDPAPPLGSGTLAGTGPGLRWNVAARLGVDLAIAERFALLCEGFWYRSKHALVDVDAARLSPTRSALGVEAGAIYSF